MRRPLLAQRFLFRFAIPCRYRSPLRRRTITRLEAAHRLPRLAELEGLPSWADVRAAWSEEGLLFTVAVSGKGRSLWCSASRPEESDGLQIWIDTRDIHNVHRATRFCHRFVFLPAGGGSAGRFPVAQWLPIPRARMHPQAIAGGLVQARSRPAKDGYLLEAFVAAEALTGFDPREHPRIGFNYAVLDRELGQQTLSAGSPLPYEEDPSLWVSLELVR